jgi:hypothetical protein
MVSTAALRIIAQSLMGKKKKGGFLVTGKGRKSYYGSAMIGGGRKRPLTAYNRFVKSRMPAALAKTGGDAQNAMKLCARAWNAK